MGNLCACEQSTGSSSKQVRSPSSSQKEDLKCTIVNKLPSIGYAPPILTKDNTILFFKSINIDGRIFIKYKLYDLYQDKIINAHTLWYNNGKLQQTHSELYLEYTYNPDNNSVYFIIMNNSVIALDLNTDQIHDLNLALKTAHGNHAKIVYNNGRVFILGAQSAQLPNENIIAIPHLKRTRQFGKYSRILTTKQSGSHYIYIVGGETVSERPNDLIRIFKCDESKWTDFSVENQEQSAKKFEMYYTGYPTHSCGIINYENKYLFQFGGVRLRKGINLTSNIYVLPLVQTKNKDVLQWNWYDLGIRLPGNGNRYHAIYLNNCNEVHLFSYDGMHMKVNMSDLLAALPLRMILQQWTEQGKTVMPTRSKSIPNIGALDLTEIETMLEDLGDEFEDYDQIMDANDIETYADLIQFDENVLREFITNEEHLKKIVATATELHNPIP